MQPVTFDEAVKVLESQNNILSNSEARKMAAMLKIAPGRAQPKILAASERSDPVWFANVVKEKVKSGQYDALYIVTKHDGMPIRDLVQLPIPKMIHFSLTTLGGTKWEPGVMKWRDLMARIEDLISQGLDPETVTIRVDPIVPGVTDMKEVRELIKRAKATGINRVRFSVMDGYSGSIEKLIRGLYTQEQMDRYYVRGARGQMHATQAVVDSIATEFLNIARAEGIQEVGSCAENVNIPGVLKEGCLPTKAVEALIGHEVDTDSKSSQRSLCLCFGGKVDALKYDNKCPSSCVYCYAHHGSVAANKYYNEDGTLKVNRLTQTRPGVSATPVEKPKAPVEEPVVDTQPEVEAPPGFAWVTRAELDKYLSTPSKALVAALEEAGHTFASAMVPEAPEYLSEDENYIRLDMPSKTDKAQLATAVKHVRSIAGVNTVTVGRVADTDTAFYVDIKTNDGATETIFVEMRAPLDANSAKKAEPPGDKTLRASLQNIREVVSNSVPPRDLGGNSTLHRMIKEELDWAQALANWGYRRAEWDRIYWGLVNGGQVWRLKKTDRGAMPGGESGDLTYYSRKMLLNRIVTGEARLDKDQQAQVAMVHAAAGAVINEANSRNQGLVAAYREALVYLPAGYDPANDALEIVPAFLREKMIRDTVSSTREHVSKKPDGTTAYTKTVRVIPVSWIDGMWNDRAVATARKVLEENGRDRQALDLMTFAKRYKDLFGKAGEDVVKHTDRMAQQTGTAYMGWLSNYFPQRYGSGNFGVAFRAAQLLVERRVDEEAMQRIDDTAEAVFDAAMNRTSLHNARPTIRQVAAYLRLAGVSVAKTDEAEAEANRRFLSGEFESIGLGTNETVASMAHKIRDLAEAVMTERVLSGTPVGAPINGIQNPAVLAASARRYTSRMKHAEFSQRTWTRTFNTYNEAFTMAGLLPKTQNPIEALTNYVGEMTAAAVNKSVLQQAAHMTNEYGAPLIVARPNTDFKGTDSAFHSVTWRKMAENIAIHFGDKVDMNLAPEDDVLRLVDKHIAKSKGYKEIESPYGSTTHFYALADSASRSNIFDALVGGETAGLLKKLIGRPMSFYVGDTDIFEVYAHIMAWMKTLELGASLFFAKSAVESLVAATRGEFYRPSVMKELFQFNRMRRSEDPWFEQLIKEMEDVGVEVSLDNYDNPTGWVEKDIRKVSEFMTQKGMPGAERTEKAMRYMTTEQGRWMFGTLFNTSKIWFAHRMSQEMMTKSIKSGTPISRKEALRLWAPAANNALGGQNWNDYSYMSPGMTQFFNSTWFSWNWTISALNVAGAGTVTSGLLKNYVLPTEANFVFLRNWPSMILLVLLAEPFLLQLAGYLIGGGDPEDEPFIWNNEEGRKTYADITPLIRGTPLYQGYPTGERRFYTRWGKQSYEVVEGWLNEPGAQLMRKWSSPVRLAYELASGQSPGSDWNLEFKGQGLLGLIQDKNGEFSGSRLGYVAKAFMPFSLQSIKSSPDTGLLPIIAPVAKGTSITAATQAFEKVLRAYVSEDTWSVVKDTPMVQKYLNDLAPEILDAAIRNGYDAKAVISGARGAVMKDLYAAFYKALDAQDEVGMEIAARKIMRINGTIDGVKNSIRNRDNMYGNISARTPEQEAAVAASFADAPIIVKEKKAKPAPTMPTPEWLK